MPLIVLVQIGVNDLLPIAGLLCRIGLVWIYRPRRVHAYRCKVIRVDRALDRVTVKSLIFIFTFIVLVGVLLVHMSATLNESRTD